MVTDTIHPANRCIMERRSCMAISPSAVLTRPIYEPATYSDCKHRMIITYMDICITLGAYDGTLIKRLT